MITRSRATAALLAAALAGCAGVPESDTGAATPVAAPPSVAAPQAPAPAPAAVAPPVAAPPAPAPAARAPEVSDGRRRIERGVAQYEQGRYAEAIRTLKDAPEIAAEPAELRLRALKTLAFSQCLLEQVGACRRTFDALLALDPAFRLAPAEAGHPSWGPVFARARAALPKQKPAPSAARTASR